MFLGPTAPVSIFPISGRDGYAKRLLSASEVKNSTRAGFRSMWKDRSVAGAGSGAHEARCRKTAFHAIFRSGAPDLLHRNVPLKVRQGLFEGFNYEEFNTTIPSG